MQQVLTGYNEYLLYTTHTYSMQQVCTLQQVLVHTMRTYTTQPVRTLCNRHLLYSTRTYTMQ